MSDVLSKYFKEPRRYRAQWFILILIVFYGVGLVGLQTESRDWFLDTTPFILLLSVGLMTLHHPQKNGYYWLVLGLSIVVGLGMEIWGVASGSIFGEYRYGETLGYQFKEVPLVIGLNWWLLVGASSAMVARSWIHPLLRALAAAGLMTGLDWLIEPVAVKLDFWSWAGGEIPLQNYLAWFAIGFVLCALYQMLPFHKQNKVATALFFLQVIFFGTLRLIL